MTTTIQRFQELDCIIASSAEAMRKANEEISTNPADPLGLVPIAVESMNFYPGPAKESFRASFGAVRSRANR